MSLIKSTKSPSDFAGMEPDFESRLELYDTGKNHNKFWHIWVYGCFVVRNYGRHGTKGQWTVHQTGDLFFSLAEAKRLLMQKYGKGYGKDTTTVLDHIARKVT